MGSSNVPNVPIDPNMGAVQSGAAGGIENLGQFTGAAQQPYQAQLQNLSTLGPGAMAASGSAGSALSGVGAGAVGQSAALSSVFPTLAPFATQALTTSFDPQNQLYAQEHQKSQDFTNVDLQNRGIESSPYGAGVAATNDQTFNTNWLQTALARQQTGANTANSLYNTGASVAGQGAALGATGAQDIAQGGALPYMTGTAMNQDLGSFIPYLTSNQQQQITDFINYYGDANQNTANSVKAGTAQDQQGNVLGTGIGTLLAGIFSGAGTKGLASLLK
jgi:hypothetical protein